MGKKLVPETFDYSKVDGETKSKLIWLAGEVNRCTKDHVSSAIKMGEAISAANELFAGKGRDGKFKHWVEAECGIGRTTAYEYMNAFEKFEKCSALGHFSAEGMYALAGPNVPEEAIQKAEKLAGKGVRITVKLAKELIAETSATPPPKKKPPASQPATVKEVSPEAAADTGDFDPAELEAQKPAGLDLATLAQPYIDAIKDINHHVRALGELAEDQKVGAHLADVITNIKFDLTQAKNTISQMQPVKVCTCGGDGCPTCSHTGFWTRCLAGSRKA